MKRKLLTILLTLVATLCLTLGLSACDLFGNSDVGGSGNTEQEETKKPDEGEERHVHDFTNYVYNNDATCTKDGTETAACSCGQTDTRTKSGTALGHKFENYAPNGDATCTEDGTETAKCIRCTETDTRTVKGSKLGHTFETYVSNGDATCTEDGTETAKCIRCTETDTRTVRGSKLGHDTEFHAGSVTCTEAGTFDYWRCSRCNKDLIDEEGTAEIEEYETDVPLGHEFTAENKCVRYDKCETEWKFTEGLTYSLNSDHKSYSVLGNDTMSGDIVIPYGYQGKWVTVIGQQAFYGCRDLTSVTIPDSVTSIGAKAFYDCSGLTGITIPDSVTSIGDYAFYDCRGLTSITIPDRVTSIGDYAFNYCYWLKSVTIGNGVTSIGADAFYDCRGLTSITIPDSVTSIGDYAFRGCSGLTGITIPDSVTLIGDYAFRGCYKLFEVWNYSELNIVKGDESNGSVARYAKCVYTTDEKSKQTTSDDGCVFYEDEEASYLLGYDRVKAELLLPQKSPSGREYEIYQYAFSYCKGLTSITIPDSVTSIGDHAFDHCTELTNITIPDSVTSIGTNAFNGTAYYEDASHWYGGTRGVLYIGNHFIEADLIWGTYYIRMGTKTIADYAFSGCHKLTSITIPDSVTSIGADALRKCNGLTSIEIPDSVTSIGDYAIEDCWELKSVTIGNCVTSIGEDAFYNCYRLTDIQFKGTGEEWQAIQKNERWDHGTGKYTITCTDGTIDKEGNVTYFEQ